MNGSPRRLAILAEGNFTPLDAKTAAGVLRYRPGDVVAVIDSTRAGQTCMACVGAGGDTPVVRDLEAAASSGATSLMIGIAPQGGILPVAWRGAVRDALVRGWDVWSGLHVFLADDPEFAALSRQHGGRLHDVRRPPPSRTVASARAAAVDAQVVLTVGTDCNVGKMTTALELVAAMRRRGTRVAFVATGQTGIFIAGGGVAVDAVPSDFVAGVVEDLVVEAARDAEVVVVEGQGALHHPGYAGVTLGLLHGACPSAMVLCHDAARAHMHVRAAADGGPPVPTLTAARSAHETALAWVRRGGRVVGAAINTSRLDATAARAAVARAEAELGMPAVDPLRDPVEPLVEAVLREAARPAPAGPSEASCA